MTADYFKINKSLGFTSDVDQGGALQNSVLADEAEQLAEGCANYSEEQTTQATVHTRQDLILIVSHIADLNAKQTKLIRRLNIVIFFLGFWAIVIALK